MTNPKPSIAGTVLVVGIVVAFVFNLAAGVAVHSPVPAGGNPGSLASLLLASFGTLVPALVALCKIGNVEKNLDHLINGKMDRKNCGSVPKCSTSASVATPTQGRPGSLTRFSGHGWCGDRAAGLAVV